MKEMKNTKPKSSILFLFLAIGFILGILAGRYFLFNSARTNEDSSYKYINPILTSGDNKVLPLPILDTLQKDLQKYADEKQSTARISIYFKYLNSGAWFGINENYEYAPASLFKVPIMIVNYKLEELHPGHLAQKTIYKDEGYYGLIQDIPPSNRLKEGQEYTLDELINQLIKYSDNSVIPYLEEKAQYSELQDIYLELGLPNPYVLGDVKDIMTPREYSTFFRVLYNASYLSNELSEKALELLSNTNYDEGLAAGIPSSVEIANKFGEREKIVDGKTVQQLHDCGIIYNPNSPYLLCIMTEGQNIEKQKEIIAEISSITYRDLTKDNR